MGNILKAVKRIVDNPIVSVRHFYEGRNRANGVGHALEQYIVDLFANTFNVEDESSRMIKHNEIFSYLGSQNNPPDLIVRQGDAIETKKVQGDAAGIQLNSSFPKSKLYADDPMITSDCAKCEDWKEKDLIYAIGSTTDTDIKYLYLVYGNCFIADKSVYSKVKTKIIEGVENIPNVEFAATKELGRVNRVDPLGITSLRIRGMWTIQNPSRLFRSYLNCHDKNATFQMTCLMKKEKFASFSEDDKNTLLNLTKENYNIEDVKIKDPNNPANLIDATLITYRIY